MQKKILIISAILVVISTVLYALTLVRQSKQAPENNPAVPNNTSVDTPLTSSVPVTSPLFANPSPSVQSRIDSLLPTWTNLGSGQYLVKNVPTLEAPSMIPDYSITYNSDSKIFTITLYNDSLLENRQKAATDLAELLTIPQSELCSLNVQVIIPQSVNVDYSNRNMSFAFCPEGVDLQGVPADNGTSNIDPDNPDGTEPDVQL